MKRDLAHLILLMFLASSCATKFRVPVNRMMLPDTVGGAFRGQFEVGKQGQANGTIDVSKPSPYPFTFKQIDGTSFLGEMSLANTVDFYWSHTSSSVSLLGAKWQFVGNPLTGGGSGHSMALTGALGGNEHEVDGNPKIEYSFNATDASLIHGYWLTGNWEIFESLGYSTYHIDGKLSGNPSGKLNDRARQLTGAAGTALVYLPIIVKTEVSYSKLNWSNSKDRDYVAWAFSLGFTF